MKLNILNRLMLLSILPKEGNFVTLKITRDLQNELAFNEEEIKECTIEQTDKGCFWQKEIDKDVEFGEKATEIVKEKLLELDKNRKLSMDMLSLAEKFI